jgi:hypothetical protein
MKGKTSAQPKKGNGQPVRPPTGGYVRLELRKGRPYYYWTYYVTIDGQRVRKKQYLGKELPKGMRLKK